jgi:hypothetical protein
MQVPRYESSVQTQGLPGARLVGTTPEAMGANLGRGVQQLGSEVAQWAAEERRKKIDTEVQDAVLKLDERTMGGLRQAKDPAAGIKGATAKDDLKRYVDDFDKFDREASAGLTDPEAQRLFRQRAGQRRASYAESLMGHADGVVFGYQNEVDTNTLKIANERASLGYDNPNELSTARADKEQALARLAERNGWTPERLAVERQQATSSMHTQVLRGYLSAGRVTEAEQYFQALKPEEMTAADRETAQKVVTQQSDAAKAQKVADDAHALVQSGMLAPTDVEGWIKDNTGDNVAQRDAARSRYKTLEVGYKEAVNATVQKSTDDALRLLLDNEGDITAVMNDPDIVGTLTRHAPDKLKAVQRMAENWSQPAETEDRARLDLDEAARTGNLGTMSKDQFYSKYRHRFSERDWNGYASALYNDAQEARVKPGKQQEFQTFVAVKDQIENASLAAGIRPKKADRVRWSDEEVQGVVDFETEASKRLTSAAYDPTTGQVRKLNDTERQKVLDGMVLEQLRAKTSGQPVSWKREVGYKDIKKMKDKNGAPLLDRFRSEAARLGNADPDDDVIERAYRASIMGAPAEEISAILQGK